MVVYVCVCGGGGGGGERGRIIVTTVTYLLRHWYRRMADSVCHAPPHFQ